jgi:5-methylcytosine-specific restriction endonuclease McrA
VEELRILTCKYCGRTRRVLKSEEDKGMYKEYCSFRCRKSALSLGNKITFTCLVCGRIKSTYQNPSKSYKYCSKECYNKFKGKDSRILICKYCGKEKVIKKVDSDRGHYKEYCSQACRNAVLGKINNQRRGGAWQVRRLQALERDKNTCRLCNNATAIHVHHIIPFRDFESGKEANKLNNIISLCDKCHKLTYRNEYEFIDLFKRILEEGVLNGGGE